MKEIRTAGTKEFIYSLLWALFLLAICTEVVNALPEYKMIGGILGIIMYAVLGYYVLTRYTSRFTYEDTGTGLRINRMIGKRNKEIEFRYSEITEISRVKPKKLPKQVYYMRASVFSDKKSYFISYTHNGESAMAVIEASAEFIKALEKAKRSHARKEKKERNEING